MGNQSPPPRRLIEDLPQKDLQKLTRLLRLPNGGPIDSTWLAKQRAGVDLLPKNLRRREGTLGTIDNIVKYRVEKATLCYAHKKLQPWLIRRIFTQITLEITSNNERLSKNEGMRPEIYQWLKGVHSLNSLMMTPQFFRQMFQEDFDYTDWRPDMIESGCEACIISYVGGSVKALQDLAISAESRKTNSQTPLLCKVLNSYIDDLSVQDYTKKMHKANVNFIKEIRSIRKAVTKAYREKRKLEMEAKSKPKIALSDPFSDPDYVQRKSEDIQLQDQEYDTKWTKRSEGGSQQEVGNFYAERFSTAGLNCAPQDIFDGVGLHPAYRQSYCQSIMSFSDVQGVGGPLQASRPFNQTYDFDPIAESEPSTPIQRSASMREERQPVPIVETPAERPQSMSSVYSRNTYCVSYSRLPKDNEPSIVPPLPLNISGGKPNDYGKNSLPHSLAGNSSSVTPPNGSTYGRGAYAGVENSRDSPNLSLNSNTLSSGSSSTKPSNTSAYGRRDYAGVANSYGSPKSSSSARPSNSSSSAKTSTSSAYGLGGYAGISRGSPDPSSPRGQPQSSRNRSQYGGAPHASRSNSSKLSGQQESAYGPGGYAGTSYPTSNSRSGSGNRGRGSSSNAQNTRAPTPPARPDSGAYGTDPNAPYTPPRRAPRNSPLQTASEAPAPGSIWVDDLVESDQSASPPPRQEGFVLPDVDDYTQMVEDERKRVTRWSNFK